MSDAALRRLEETYPPIVSTAMVAEILGLNARTVLLMAQDGRLAASRIPGSRSYRFFLADVVDHRPHFTRRILTAERCTGAQCRAALIDAGVEPWAELSAYRNRLAHALPGDLSSDRIWADTTSDLPRILEHTSWRSGVDQRLRGDLEVPVG